MEKLLRQLLNLVDEQTELTQSKLQVAKSDLDKTSLYDVAHSSGVVYGRLQVLRAIETLLMDYTK